MGQQVGLRLRDDHANSGAVAARDSGAVFDTPSRFRLLPFLVTLLAVLLAGLAVWAIWQAYIAAPWTRDGRVRVYVVTLAPQVEGQVVDLPVIDNQFVHKGDLLMRIDPRDYQIAVAQAQAQLDQARADMENKEEEAQRREKLTSLSTSVEEKQTYATNYLSAQASFQEAMAALAKARINLERTEIRSPVNGWVTNLLVQQGDYASVGTRALSVVNADSFWVDGYFEETNLARIRVGDPALISLMGYPQILHGHVDSFAHGINVANAAPDAAGLASVNPIFTWVRLAQRVPVRIHIDTVPPGVALVAGMTASVTIR